MGLPGGKSGSHEIVYNRKGKCVIKQAKTACDNRVRSTKSSQEVDRLPRVWNTLHCPDSCLKPQYVVTCNSPVPSAISIMVEPRQPAISILVSASIGGRRQEKSPRCITWEIEIQLRRNYLCSAQAVCSQPRQSKSPVRLPTRPSKTNPIHKTKTISFFLSLTLIAILIQFYHTTLHHSPIITIPVSVPISPSQPRSPGTTASSTSRPQHRRTIGLLRLLVGQGIEVASVQITRGAGSQNQGGQVVFR